MTKSFSIQSLCLLEVPLSAWSSSHVMKGFGLFLQEACLHCYVQNGAHWRRPPSSFTPDRFWRACGTFTRTRSSTETLRSSSFSHYPSHTEAVSSSTAQEKLVIKQRYTVKCLRKHSAILRVSLMKPFYFPKSEKLIYSCHSCSNKLMLKMWNIHKAKLWNLWFNSVLH